MIISPGNMGRPRKFDQSGSFWNIQVVYATITWAADKGYKQVLLRIDRYLLRGSIGLFLGILGLAIAILLIERLIRLTEILSGADNPILNATRLISSLLPHYVELALPGALLITTILTINRFSRSGEITAMLASGTSLYRIARPFFLAGVLLAGSSLLTSGFLQPLTRYNYREVIFELRQDSIVAAFQEFKFVQFGDRTIWTDGIDTDQMTLGETFIYEKRDDGTSRFLIGESGLLDHPQEGGWVVDLSNAMIGDLPQTIGVGKSNHASAGSIDWELPMDNETFRTRGKDERELTLSELLSRSYKTDIYQIDPNIASAEIHDRFVRAALLIVLSFTGVFLGLNLGRNLRVGGLATGIILLLVVQKLLEFGLLKAQQGIIPPWAGAWPLFTVLTLVSLFYFARANGSHYRGFGIRISRSSTRWKVDSTADRKQM